MPINKKNAAAFINVRGLGIVCFNPQTGQCEVALIREGSHKLSINVSKPGLISESGKDIVGFVPVLSVADNELPPDVSIEISAIGNAETESYKIFQSGEFDRLKADENDINDFRWIVNLEGGELHGAALVKPSENSAENKPPVSRLYVGNGEFYAVMPDLEDPKILASTPFFNKKDETGETAFGYIAETMGVNIEAESVCLKIRRGEDVETHIFVRVENSPYKIEISNINPDPESVMSDLPTYYKFLCDAGGRSFELNPQKDDSTAGGSVQGKVYCHIAKTDQETIDYFV